MRRGGPLALLFCLAVLSAFLAGCSGGGDGGGAPPAATDGPASGAPAMVTLKNGLAGSVHHTVWANGTVAFQDTCNTGGCITDTSRAIRPTDITEHVPAGAPVRLEIELTYSPNPVGFGGFETWVQSEGGTYYAYDVDWELGHELVKVVFVPEGKVEVVMAAYGPGGEAPETPYELRVTVDADNETLPDGVPVAVRLGPGATLEADAGGAQVAFVLYGPDDQPVGRFDDSTTLPEDAASGDYVVLLPNGQPAARLRTDSGAETMRLLPLRAEMGPVGDLPPNGAYDGSWDVTGIPIGVGIAAYNLPSALGPSPIVSTGFTMSLRGPGGFTLDSGNLCGICLSFGEYFVTWSSGLGDERVTAGAYTVHAETQFTYQVQVVPYALYFDRA